VVILPLKPISLSPEEDTADVTKLSPKPSAAGGSCIRDVGVKVEVGKASGSSHSSDTDRPPCVYHENSDDGSTSSDTDTPKMLSAVSPAPRRGRQLGPVIRPSGRVLDFGSTQMSTTDETAREAIRRQGETVMERDFGLKNKDESGVIIPCDGCGAGKTASSLTVVKPCRVSTPYPCHGMAFSLKHRSRCSTCSASPV
jgi:hypothetical protein